MFYCYGMQKSNQTKSLFPFNCTLDRVVCHLHKQCNFLHNITFIRISNLLLSSCSLLLLLTACSTSFRSLMLKFVCDADMQHHWLHHGVLMSCNLNQVSTKLIRSHSRTMSLFRCDKKLLSSSNFATAPLFEMVRRYSIQNDL